MHPGKILSAAIYTGQVFCLDLSTLHTSATGQDTPELVVSKCYTGLCPPQGQPDFKFYTLQHNISSDQESTCIWSDNYEQQYCVFADPQFDHGKGIIVITTPERARQIFRTTAFAANHLSSTRELLFRTKAGGRKGRGIFANNHIPAGSLVTQESPIVFQDQSWIEDISSKEARDTLQALAIEKLPKSTRQGFHELYVGSYTGGGLEHKIMTNGYGVSSGPTEGWPGLENEADPGMVVVHANISKINHGCRPNAAVQWDWDLLAHKMYAVRDIAAGEEITMPYFDTRKPLRERQQYTNETLGFECACSQCKATSPFADLSDDRINEILLLEQYLDSRQVAPAEPTAMAELLVSLYKQEGLDVYISKAYAIAAREWNGAGYEYQARSWAYQSVKAGLIDGLDAGNENYLEDMEELLDGARRHWSWRYRVH